MIYLRVTPEVARERLKAAKVGKHESRVALAFAINGTFVGFHDRVERGIYIYHGCTFAQWCESGVRFTLPQGESESIIKSLNAILVAIGAAYRCERDIADYWFVSPSGHNFRWTITL